MIKEVNYKNLDIARYICAIVVIIVHLGTFKNISPDVNYFFNNIVSRICVPLFIFITGFFIGKKEIKNNNYISKYIKNLLPLYIFWSLIYLPFGINYLVEINLPIYLYPIGILFGFTYIGTWYHLWYFPALIFSLLILKYWKKKFSVNTLFVISLFLLIIGSFETYYGILPDFLKNIVVTYKSVFYTTRNFLFFSLFYVVFGYLVGIKKKTKVNNINFKLIISIILLFVEGYFLKSVERLDCNILITPIFVVYYLFMFLINTKDIKFIKFKYPLRELYKYYYLIHMISIIFITFIFDICFKLNVNNEYQILILLFATIITHILSNVVLYIKNKNNHF